MLPKQVDSIFDLLDSYECEEITLRRLPPIHAQGRLMAEYQVSLTHKGELKVWKDHALPRLLATVVVEMTTASPWPDGVPHQPPDITDLVPEGH